MNKAQKPARIREFDVLRAIAIILLLFHHGGIYNYALFGFPLSEISSYVAGYLLGIFFFISGYLLVETLSRRTLSEFIRLRFLRIYLPYWVALILFLVLMGESVNKGWMDILFQALGTQILVAPRFGFPYLTLWFVGLIIIYYLIFGILLKLIHQKGLFVFAGVMVFLIAAIIRKYLGVIEYRFFWYFSIFFAGVMFSKFFLLKKLATYRFRYIVETLLFVTSVIFLYPYRHLSDHKVIFTEIMFYDFFILSAILLTISLSGWITRRGEVPGFVRKLTYLSFFAYLFHRPIWTLLLRFYTPQEQFIPVYVMMIGIPLVLFLTYGMQKAYDPIYQILVKRIQTARITSPQKRLQN